MKEIDIDMKLNEVVIHNNNFNKVFKRNFVSNTEYYFEVYTGAYRFVSEKFMLQTDGIHCFFMKI